MMAGLAGRSELSGRGPTKQGHGAGCHHTLLDVLPVGQLGVALLSRAAVELEKWPHREGRQVQGGGASDRERDRPRETQAETDRDKQTDRRRQRWRRSRDEQGGGVDKDH